MVDEETQELINDFLGEYISELLDKRKEILLGTIHFERFCRKDSDLANKLLEITNACIKDVLRNQGLDSLRESVTEEIGQAVLSVKDK